MRFLRDLFLGALFCVVVVIVITALAAGGTYVIKRVEPSGPLAMGGVALAMFGVGGGLFNAVVEYGIRRSRAKVGLPVEGPPAKPLPHGVVLGLKWLLITLVVTAAVGGASYVWVEALTFADTLSERWRDAVRLMLVIGTAGTFISLGLLLVGLFEEKGQKRE